MDVIVDLAILIGLLVLGVPVPFCFMAAVLFMFIIGGYDPMFIMATGFHKVNSMAVLCILFFILMGGLMGSGGIAARLVAISDAILGRTKSGLGTVSIVSCAVFGAIAGTCTAAVAAIGSIMIPRMVERGYPRGQATALVAAPGTAYPSQCAHDPVRLGNLAIGRSVLLVHCCAWHYYGSTV